MLCRCFNAQYGLWDESMNKKLYAEVNAKEAKFMKLSDEIPPI